MLRLREHGPGPRAVQLAAHALAPVAELPVLEVVSAIHIVADLTLGLGKVVHDYLRPPQWREKPGHFNGNFPSQRHEITGM